MTNNYYTNQRVQMHFIFRLQFVIPNCTDHLYIYIFITILLNYNTDELRLKNLAVENI